MAALDDSWDVHDKCVAMGLDPDSKRDLATARAAMYAEHEADWKARGGKPGKGGVPTPGMLKLFKDRYGK